MRIWSIHPQYLDSKGLVALWRETLLAQNVLLGKTKGYKNHPQLLRFKNSKAPLEFIGSYLEYIWQEADRRGYCFDQTKIIRMLPGKSKMKLNVTDGQIIFETKHLLKKLKIRDIILYQELKKNKKVLTHPLFRKTSGAIEAWEKTEK